MISFQYIFRITKHKKLNRNMIIKCFIKSQKGYVFEYLKTIGQTLISMNMIYIYNMFKI